MFLSLFIAASNAFKFTMVCVGSENSYCSSLIRAYDYLGNLGDALGMAFDAKHITSSNIGGSSFDESDVYMIMNTYSNLEFDLRSFDSENSMVMIFNMNIGYYYNRNLLSSNKTKHDILKLAKYSKNQQYSKLDKKIRKMQKRWEGTPTKESNEVSARAGTSGLVIYSDSSVRDKIFYLSIALSNIELHGEINVPFISFMGCSALYSSDGKVTSDYTIMYFTDLSLLQRFGPYKDLCLFEIDVDVYLRNVYCGYRAYRFEFSNREYFIDDTYYTGRFSIVTFSYTFNVRIYDNYVSVDGRIDGINITSGPSLSTDASAFMPLASGSTSVTFVDSSYYSWSDIKNEQPFVFCLENSGSLEINNKPSNINIQVHEYVPQSLYDNLEPEKPPVNVGVLVGSLVLVATLIAIGVIVGLLIYKNYFKAKKIQNEENAEEKTSEQVSNNTPPGEEV